MSELVNQMLISPVLYVVCCGLVVACALATSSSRAATRRDRAWRIGWSVLLAVAVVAVDAVFVDSKTAWTAVETPMCLVALWVFAVAIMRMGIATGTYVAVWSLSLVSPISEVASLLTMWFDGWVRWCVRLAALALMMAVLYVCCRRWLAPQLQMSGRYLMSRRKVLFTLVMVAVFMTVADYRVIFWLIGSSEPSNMVPAFRVLVETLCCIVLYLQNDIERRQKAQLELNMVQELWRHQRHQYQVSKETIDVINRKCHDLKYQVAAFRATHGNADIDRQLGEIEHSVDVYDSVVRTGNPVLDVVLTEKSLYCEAQLITMTCMADASRLDFIEQSDLYALFGNAIDNAIESVMKQSDPDKRVIQVSVRPENDFLLIQVRNYCDEPIELVDGLPLTSKTSEPGYHGYGLRGIRYTAERYGGTMGIRTDGKAFTLQVLLPLPVRQPRRDEDREPQDAAR
ncbi:histidine kinase [Bifidobacterium lemurum]|uniref:Histidine kinase n=1 Tax=Bifidobacterium lemurum TaxID=1603886 RepID=A0A261FQX6_9BIFI|nr:sensor histidine kinase [Bifidobacterium lemurum]OZG61488.1 histidine kinase [Bifidobacterium lemurum]QOL35090.1 GHKL domain-containing protein [Bifidobacterium lemurum]